MLLHWPGIRRARRWWRGFWLVSALRRCCPWSGEHAGRSQTHCQTSLRNSGRCRWSPAWLWHSAVSKRSFGRHQPGSRLCRRRKTERHQKITTGITQINKCTTLWHNFSRALCKQRWHNYIKSSSRAKVNRKSYEIEGLGPFYTQMSTNTEYTHIKWNDMYKCSGMDMNVSQGCMFYLLAFPELAVPPPGCLFVPRC